MLLLVYLLQHPIFIVARIPFFILYIILTCCCDKEDEVEMTHELKDTIIHFDYIEWNMNVLENFVNYQAGRADFEFNRNLQIARGTIRRSRDEVSMIQSLR